MEWLKTSPLATKAKYQFGDCSTNKTNTNTKRKHYFGGYRQYKYCKHAGLLLKDLTLWNPQKIKTQSYNPYAGICCCDIYCLVLLLLQPPDVFRVVVDIMRSIILGIRPTRGIDIPWTLGARCIMELSSSDGPYTSSFEGVEVGRLWWSADWLPCV